MASPTILLSLLLLAGCAHNASSERITLPSIDVDFIVAIITDIINNLPEIIERIREFLVSLPDLVAGLEWSQVLESIQNFINNTLPIIINTIPEIIAQLPGNLPEIIGNIFPQVLEVLQTVSYMLQYIFSQPDFIASLRVIFDTVVDFIRRIDWPAIGDALSGITLPDIDWSAIIDMLPDIISQLPNLIATLPEILENLPEIIRRLRELIAEAPIDWDAISAAIPEIDRDHGVLARLQDTPSIVQLEIGYGPIWVMGCTGSVINSLNVLTGARCFTGFLSDPRIRRVNAGAERRGDSGDMYQISHILPHPSFGLNGFDGDIALVRTISPIQYNANVQPTSIIAQNIFFPANVRVLTVGWGSTAQGRNLANRDLYKADLYVVDNNWCATRYNNYSIPLTVTSNMVCAGRLGSGGRAADLRDGGGPMYYDGVLMGVNSFGRYLGADTLPVVATAVSSYSNWIVQTAV